MTPLYDWLDRFLPPGLTAVAVTVIYAMLIVMIVTFLIPPTPLELVYLDVGK
jgi:predicted PurR-regulated permease PerM